MLPDEAHLVLQPEPDSDFVAVTFIIRMPADDTPLDNATGELVSRALFFGSVNSPYENMARSVAQTGGNLETLRTPDYVAVECVTVPNQLPEALYLLSEAIKNAQFTPETLKRAADSYVRARSARATDPFEAAYSACIDNFPAVQPVDATLFSHITPDRARSYFLTHYVPNRTVISVAGRFDPAWAADRLTAHLVDYDRHPPRFPAFPSPAQALAAAKNTHRDPVPGSSAFAMVGISGPPLTSPDFPAFTVLAGVLGTGHASRMFQHIREKLGLGYDTGTLLRADRGDPLVAYIQWDPTHAPSTAKTPDDVAGLITQEIDGLLSDPPTDAEVARARSLCIGRDALRHERVRERGFMLAWYEAMELGAGFDAEFHKRLAAVTRDDVLRVAHAYLGNRSVEIAAPSSQ
jgi:zinc protease